MMLIYGYSRRNQLNLFDPQPAIFRFFASEEKQMEGSQIAGCQPEMLISVIAISVVDKSQTSR